MCFLVSVDAFLQRSTDKYSLSVQFWLEIKHYKAKLYIKNENSQIQGS